ncbi:MAG: leucine--tRNA ligase [Elusimicrobia bacterium]|nr:leucine--tRNA ligase [Elusimicrobiota bacterium]
MDYEHLKIESKWRKYWADNKIFKTENGGNKPKYYILDMFPYPSGAGLHVGHPLGYIASDIYARYKMLKGFNVLHPMGYDAFGLPAEQYAVETGQHPAVTTDKNIKRYREQMDLFGFSYDWDREFRTSDPDYYKWTQWVFIKLFHHYYDINAGKAKPIKDLISHFEKNGTKDLPAFSSFEGNFTAQDWISKSESEKSEILMNFRLAYLAETSVNWCPALGTVLANDEVSDGFSVRGGHPVERKKMKQWSLRITAYADRLLEGLDRIDWPENVKEMQRNWIGKSKGTILRFELEEHKGKYLEIFTTRPDTVFGVTFMSVAPDHKYLDILSKPNLKSEVLKYAQAAKNKSELEIIASAKTPSGVFTGSYAINPFNGEKVPVWVADYVIGGYGTGAVMAVPAHDSRDYAFAKYFNLPIKEVIKGGDISKEAYESKEGICVNSGFINGLSPIEAAEKVSDYAQEKGFGKRKINYRLRDAIFSRQRYWGEPFPVYYKKGIPFTLDESELPLKLPEIDKYQPTETGEPPLARAKNWTSKEGYPLETSTMPGFAGSSGYYLRYMDPKNDKEYFSREAVNYWKSVDFYVGGSEHATGHLIYARFWNKFLYDLGMTPEDEPFKKLFNQGMIQGRSNFVYRAKAENLKKLKEILASAADASILSEIENSDAPVFVSKNLPGVKEYCFPVHVDINIVDNDVLDLEAFKKWRPEYKNAKFITENGKYICGWEVEKMSKSKYNVQNPDDLIEKYGADTLRMYEMFLGPVEQSKPWDIKGIEGVHRFLKKFWKLFFNEKGEFSLSDQEATQEELKILHKTIKKVSDDIERFSLNTCVSAFMICVNELTEIKCSKKSVLEPLIIAISPFAPHMAEELWAMSGNKSSVSKAAFPVYDEKYLAENKIKYPVSFNGKTRFFLEADASADKAELENSVISSPEAQKWLKGEKPKKIIVVPGRIINVVI